MTTGMNIDRPGHAPERRFGDRQERQQVAADHQDRRDEQGVLEAEHQRHPELVVARRPASKLPVPMNLGGVISDQLWNEIQTIWTSG